ncbi:Uncharacterized conserved protein YecE, DUF72 family [Mucilaginibacter gossypiicola]|uniref:Uncharacterized conserved protein YecE, DUF72 family n=1 Tax=Mucilaginibacter gossypiicola TaxID=551995 RepID=A0A1H8LUM7_9SPHI|nr:DUF72 domain-containing protein [Mucilaginibacter gossypiicola]SEO08817.1 Uncharacterized conserved protein YecE, DUF72 family [Mucilaginibacter gossypiicola]
MEFGRAGDSLNEIDFRLPQDSQSTINTLKSKNTGGDLSVYIGASKWGEKTWKGILYPHGLPDKNFLGVYGQNFNTVEFGPTFYGIYEPEVINRWAAQVSESPEFKFCPKFPQIITHMRRLTNAEEQTIQFYQSSTGFGNHLGPLLLQLGEGFTPKSFPQLKAFLESLPPTIKVHVEVRHKDWFGNTHHRSDLFHLLDDLNIGTVISDTAGRRDCVHMELTTTDAVIRFVGNNLADSDYSRMDDWADRLKDWKEKGLQTVWFFMHQNDEKHVPEACVYFINQLNSRLGTSIKPPNIIAG